MPVRFTRILAAAAALAVVAAVFGTGPGYGRSASAAKSPTAAIIDSARTDAAAGSGTGTGSNATTQTGTTTNAPAASSGSSPSAAATATPTTAAPTAAAPTTAAPTTVTAAPATTANPAVQTGPISGTEKVWVSVVETTPQTSDDVNTGMTQAAITTLVGKLNSYWSAQSGGAVTIQLGGYETRSLGESSCNPNAALSAEETQAFGGMFANDAWKGTHNHLLVLSTESCGAESFATVGGVGGEIFSGNGIGASTGVEYLLHEFGHNLGFEHADASICTNTTSYDATAASFSLTSTTCPTREYDDYFDIMGYTVANATPNLSSPQRIMAGWLTNYATLTGSTASVTETLTPLSGSGGIQALKIVDPVSGDDYYIEYRTDSGLDATSAEFNYGLQCDPAVSGYTICELDSSKATGVIRILRFIPFPSSGANGTTVMAVGLTAGSTDKTKRHTHLDSGDSFTSVDGGFTLAVNSLSPSSGASVTVTFPGSSVSAPSTPAPTPAAPAKVTATVAIAAKSTILRAGSTDSIRVTVKQSNTSTPAGTLVLVVNGAKVAVYTLPTSVNGTVTITTPALTTRGANTISVAFTGSSGSTASASQKITVD